jgi:putative ABC transport system permease protein
MDVITRRLEQRYPETNAGWGVRMRTFYDWMVPAQIRRSVLALFAAVGFVLLIACANVANLLLARASTRRREIALRSALGASRWRVMRQLLTESLLLSALGGTAGTGLAFVSARLLRTAATLKIPRLDETRLDLRALGFTFAVTALTGIIFGLAPAWQAARLGINETLKEGGRAGAGGGRRSLRDLLVVSEVALALALLLGAGLMARSFARLQSAPLGFAPENALTMLVNLPGSKYGGQAQRVDFYNRLLERLRTTPGVKDAAAITQLPLADSNGWANEITLEGGAAAPSAVKLSASTFAVTPRYFHTMGIPLLQGRDFTEQDRGQFGDGTMPLIVNEAFARRFWPNQNPIGKRFRPGSVNVLGAVVGVVGDIRNFGLENEAGPTFYFSYGYLGMPSLAIVTRTTAAPEALTGAVRAQVQALDHDLPVYNVRTMERLVSNAAAPPRFQTTLLAIFSAVALLLATVGVYGVMAYAVVQRAQEIGVRVALGAQAGDVRALIVRQGMALSLAGVGIGMALAFALTRYIAGLLYQVSATDSLTFVTGPLVLVGATLLACYFPARRATKIDPIAALRQE